MHYRPIKGTSIEVPDWVQVPAFSEFSEARLARSRRAIAYLRHKYFGSSRGQDGGQHGGQHSNKINNINNTLEKTKPQPL